MSNCQGRATVPIFLLKTRSAPHDSYEAYFSNPTNGYFRPTFVPVLEHHFHWDALSKLKRWLSRGQDVASDRVRDGLPYGGIIFTSQRAVEAFSEIVTGLRHCGAGICTQLDCNFPFYVVGPATARGLRSLNLACDIVGEESGNGETLAHIILQDYAQRPQGQCPTKSPLLFLVGEQRRDIIPKTLQSTNLPYENRVPVDEMVIYETGEMQTFRHDFKRTWVGSVEEHTCERWVVVFSPAGCKAMLETLQLLDPVTGKVQSNAAELRDTFIATIGPTTRDHLNTEFGFEPDVCAPKPSPEGVGDAIRQHMQQRARTQGLGNLTVQAK